MSDVTAFEAVQQAIADAIGDACDCTRVWEAWSVGTMTQDDFVLVTDDPDRLHEITMSAIAAMPAPTVKPLVNLAMIEDILSDCTDEGTFEWGVNSDAVIGEMARKVLSALEDAS